jgi:hypothetical protein
MRARLVLAATLAGLIGSALLIIAAEAADPAKPYLGMSRDEVIACAGAPYAKYKSGAEAETLTYHYSGAGPVPGAPGEKKKKEGGLANFLSGGDTAEKTEKNDKKDKTSEASDTSDASDASQPRVKGSGKKGKKKNGGWTCTASLTFENGRLARVAFAHKDVRSPYDWQKEKDPKKQEALRNAPLPTCTFSLPNCTRAQ